MIFDTDYATQYILISSFFLSAAALWFGHKPAAVAGLTDKPDDRKIHKGHVPLLGGLGVVAALITISPLTVSSFDVAAIVFLTFIVGMMGLMDDLYNLSAKCRLIIQLSVGIALAVWVDVRITSLGNIFGYGDITFGFLLSVTFTAFCVVGIINAINMVDGVDGLFGGTALLSLSSIAYFCVVAGETDMLTLALITIGGLVAFLAFNLDMFGASRKVFAGDCGSMAIGFLIAAMMVKVTQSDGSQISPVVAGWVVGFPIIDTVTVMIRRITKGQSPLAPGRDHFHHILLDSGLSKVHTLLTILAIQICLIGGGLLVFNSVVEQYFMFWVFVLLTVFHFYLSKKVVNLLLPKNPKFLSPSTIRSHAGHD